MDDIIVLAKSRWQLRRTIATINQHFERIKLKQHPDKTFAGKVKKGFDFRGYQFGLKTLSVAIRTLFNHLRRLSRLYEQKKGHPQWTALFDDYRRRWFSWVYSGIPSSLFNYSHSNREFYGACLTQECPSQKLLE